MEMSGGGRGQGGVNLCMHVYMCLHINNEHACVHVFTQQDYLLDCMTCFADVFGVELISKMVYKHTYIQVPPTREPPTRDTRT